jgi:hypothetical protein
MTYSKNYIGKGKKAENLDIIKVTLRIEDVLKFKYEREGTEYITFELAAMKEPDNYGKTHTAYVSQKVATPADKAQEPATSKQTRKRKAVKK